jgi:hypothetical protein
MRTFDPTTTSGTALAELFRTWCQLRDNTPELGMDGGVLVGAVRETFETLGLDVDGPASQVDAAADQHVFTVFGLSCDHSDELYVAGVIPGEHAEAVVELATSEEHFGRWASTFTAPSADAAAQLAYAQVEDGDTDGHYDRTVIPGDPEYGDVTPTGCAYPPNLLDDLREELDGWFDDHPTWHRPRAVTFTVTTDYDDGPWWDTQGPTFHYDADPDREERRDIPVDKLPDVDFDGTAVDGALVALGEWSHPQPGDTLRIAFPTT